MPTTEHRRMDPYFEWRLKTVLDQITPPASFPRYASMPARRITPWRIAPIMLAAAASILLALAATATTGSPNPAVWTGDAASAIGSVRHTVEASPGPVPSPAQPPAPPRKAAVPAPSHQPEHKASPRPQPSDRPEESPRPRPSASPSPSEDHSGSSSGSPSPSPSPQSGDH
jgi:hypothetical protein